MEEGQTNILEEWKEDKAVTEKDYKEEAVTENDDKDEDMNQDKEVWREESEEAKQSDLKLHEPLENLSTVDIESGEIEDEEES